MEPKIAFVCTGNSCRSQIAEGFAKHYGSDVLEVYSGGTNPAVEINPKAVAVMKEIGIDISNQCPKRLDEIPSDIDILITMGCGVVCPFIPNNYEEDWGLDDPAEKDIDDFRITRNIIKIKVKELIEKVRKNQL